MAKSPPHQHNLDNNQILASHANLPTQEQLFTKDFINKHSLDISYLNDGFSMGESKSFREFLNKPFDCPLGYYATNQSLLCYIWRDINKEQYHKTLQECYEQIDFHPNIKEVIKTANLLAQKLGEYISIHIRAGDVLRVHNPFIFRGKVSQIYLVLEIIKKKLEGGSKVILFSDNLALLKDVKTQCSQIFGDKSKNILLIDDILKGDSLIENKLEAKNTQMIGGAIATNKTMNQMTSQIEEITGFYRSIFELTLLSKSKVLYAPGSGFSRLGQIIGNIYNINIYSYFSIKEQYKIMLKNLSIYHFSTYIEAFCYMNLYELSIRLKLSRNLAKEYIKKAYLLDSGNLTYSVLYIGALLDSKDYMESSKLLKQIYCNNKDKYLDILLSYDFDKTYLFNFSFKGYVFGSDVYISYFAYCIALRLITEPYHFQIKGLYQIINLLNSNKISAFIKQAKEANINDDTILVLENLISNPSQQKNIKKIKAKYLQFKLNQAFKYLIKYPTKQIKKTIDYPRRLRKKLKMHRFRFNLLKN
ncbi:MAG: hypothetical protein K2P17_00045 [Helicobacteraceae bacterium]|nr:hypothetical protein [Helicobacteraceae bacterium]